jgi:CxxC motif-containing protein (DUF1111 family)
MKLNRQMLPGPATVPADTGTALRAPGWASRLALHGGLALMLTGVAAVGCGTSDDAASTEVTSQDLTASISGTIVDSQGRALNGVTVRLNGRTQATATTGNPGTYSFPINIPDATASWSIMPSRNGCTFNPSVTNLSGVNGNRTANFTGTGTGCVGVANTPPAITGVDPGPRAGAAAAGTALPGLGAQEQAFFIGATEVFKEVDSVSGDGANDGQFLETGIGLGPTFNGNSCAMCHAQPAAGGSSPGLTSPQNPIANPQVALATLRGATNVVPSFITAAGPVREARFPVAGGGGVSGLFTIAGRNDAPGCVLPQPNFATQVASGDVIFRIPTPTFGLGLIENTPDTVLRNNLAANAAAKAALGITGAVNTSGNDGTVTRFGWKAQNKSLLIFSGEAYNVEQGVSNEAFSNERSAVAGCVFNGSPEDHTDNGGAGSGTSADISSDLVNFAAFMRFSAPPTPAAPTASTTAGAATFASVGCASCHTASLTTGPSPFAPLNNATYAPFSDIAVHHMGTGLSDGTNQGGAGPDQFRTAPLWGAGQRLFFLHDGRASNLVQAIQAHSGAGSEANAVVTAFTALPTAQQQNVLNFIRSL